jgi:hypothetical protein
MPVVVGFKALPTGILSDSSTGQYDNTRIFRNVVMRRTSHCCGGVGADFLIEMRGWIY